MRVLIDGIYTEEKPAALTIIYSLATMFFSVIFILKGREKKSIHMLITIIFLFLALMASALYSETSFGEHFKFILQIYVPCVFLTAATMYRDGLKSAAILFKKYFAIPCVFFMAMVSYRIYKSAEVSGSSFYEFYQNAPNHVIAQTILKLSLVFQVSSIFLIAALFLLLMILNVRSVILAYTLSLINVNAYKYRKREFLKKVFYFGLPAVIIMFFSIDWVEVANRVFFKGRGVETSGVLVNLSSGRTMIYEYYISYISDNFTWVNWLFGAGPIWVSSSGPKLGPHNDVLTMIVSSGLVGLVAIIYCYTLFYRSLNSDAKKVFAISFLVLFMTNGILGHQSNILFVLLYGYLGLKNNTLKLVR